MNLSLGFGMGSAALLRGAVSAFATGILTAGDSLMAGASGVVLWETVDSDSGLAVINLAVGGAPAEDVRDQFVDVSSTNPDLLNYPVVIWDGSPNVTAGYTNASDYCDLLATGIAEIPHNRWLIIPPINPYGSTYSGGQPEAIWQEMVSRWPGHVLHWADGLVNTSYAIDISQFVDAPTDVYHISQDGADNMSALILGEMRSRGWIGTARFDPLDMDGLVAYYIPTSDVSGITNQAQDAYHLSQSNASWRGTYDVADGVPKLVFDGTKRYYEGGPTPGVERTVAAAFKNNSAATMFLLGARGSTDTRSSISTDSAGVRFSVGADSAALRFSVINTTRKAMVVSHDGTTVRGIITNSNVDDASPETTAAQSGVTTPNEPSMLGNFNDAGTVFASLWFDGNFEAWLEWDRVLTGDEMRSVRSWLRREVQLYLT